MSLRIVCLSGHKYSNLDTASLSANDLALTVPEPSVKEPSGGITDALSIARRLEARAAKGPKGSGFYAQKIDSLESHADTAANIKERLAARKEGRRPVPVTRSFLP